MPDGLQPSEASSILATSTRHHQGDGQRWRPTPVKSPVLGEGGRNRVQQQSLLPCDRLGQQAAASDGGRFITGGGGITACWSWGYLT